MSDIPVVEIGPARVGDIGTVIQLIVSERDGFGALVPIDLTTATSASITFQRPDGTTFTKVATIATGTNGQITCELLLGDLTMPGRYPLQGQIAVSASQWRTSEAVLLVDRSL